MSKLKTVLWELYLQGDPRISVLASFQEGLYTYVKIAINDGKHDIIIEKIEENVFPVGKDIALNDAIASALEEAAKLMIVRELAPMIAEFSSDPV